MIALVPVSVFRVTYDIGTGRPYSRFEGLLLRAIGEGTGTVAALSEAFAVHPRLVIEGLITLIHAGWVALGDEEDGRYVTTAEGAAALREETIPPSLRVVPDLRSPVVMERISGLLAPGSEVEYQSEWNLRGRGVWEHCVRLRPEFFANRLDEGQVQHLLHRPEGHWLERVGPIRQESKHAHWAPVTVELEEGEVHLPTRRWSGLLAERILEQARSVEEEGAGDKARTQRWRARKRRARPQALDQIPVAVQPEDLLSRGTSHKAQLERVLGEASEGVLIASAFVTAHVLERLEPSILAALARGTDVDILWGYDAQGGEAINRLKKIEYAARDERGKLRFNRERTGSHAKVLVWQHAAGVSGAVGSYNWLSAKPDPQPQRADELSLMLHEPAAVASVLRSVAGLWLAPRSETLAAAPNYWRAVAAELERDSVLATADELPDRVRIVRDREHESSLIEAIMSDSDELVIGSHQLGPPAAIRLRGLVASAREGRRVRVVYGEANDQPALDAVSALCTEAEAELEHQPGLHAKFLAMDDRAVVGSYNFLSADPYAHADQARELSIELAGPGAALVRDALAI